MKKLYLLFSIFLILICISSFSWAASTNLTTVIPTNNNLSPYLQILYDDYSSYINQNNIDLNEYYLLCYTFENYLELYLSSEPLVVRSSNSNNFYSRGVCFYAEFEQVGNTVNVFTFSYINTSISNDWGAINILDSTNIYVNKDYIINNVNNSFVVQDVFAEYLYNDYPCNYVITDSNDNIVIEKEENNVSTSFFEPILMIDDYNFKKSFKYTFKIPQIRQDTKYYVFLDNYTRNSYSSVTSDFVIITVTTPEGYDFSQYYNYLYYDDLDEQIYLPRWF